MKSQQQGCYSGRVRHISGIWSSWKAVASSWESMDVIYSHTCSYKWILARSPHRHLQPIVLLSLMLKPANVTHLRIEEDLIYTSVHKALGFDQSYSCSKGVFGRRQSLSTVNCITLNVKWRRHVLLPTLNGSYSKTY